MSTHLSVLPKRRPGLAFSVELSRNLIVQSLVTAMVAVAGLTVASWQPIAVWAVFATLLNIAEDQVLVFAGKRPAFARSVRWTAPTLRILSTSLYALAALILIGKGAPATRLFAFALIACSMVYVLMRYYRSPWIFLASITPYVAILGIIGVQLAGRALAQGQVMNAVVCTFTLGIFAVLLWSARAQLATNWTDLLKAREEAEQREEAADAANRAKSHFLTTMSHELRTPLNGVLGMAQALTAEGLTPTQRERVRVIHRSGESLLAVLNDLLDLSKIEASALELEVAEFDLEHMVRGVVAAFRPEAQKKGLSFDFDLATETPGRYRGDSARIKRILYNLSSNAVKFTDAGGVTLSAAYDDGLLVCRVTDTGIGIATEDQAQLFDNFFQADASLTRKHGGSGLGLAICRDLTQLMGGTVTVDSKPGEGATFTVSLPLHKVASVSESFATCAAPADDRPAELRVLAAEDNETNRLVLKTLLAQAGITPVFAVDGLEALSAWERQEWDIVLMDIQMPQMDGVTATRAIRQREADTGRARMPIIAVTANAMAHQLAEYRAAGIDAVVSKPIDITHLFSVMEEVLDAADARAEAEAAA
jgi:signal transduction histidine kinase/CheY-like chemotaxis protein